MVKAGKLLKEMFSDLQHVTCVVHMLHRWAEFVSSENLIADELCSLIKQLLLRSNTRKNLYKDITGLPLPPVPSIVRWGTWIVAILFHAENFSALEDFTRQLEFDGTFVVKRIKQLIADDEKNQCLKAQLAFIAANFAFLPEAITKLQGRIPLADAFSVLNDVQAKVVLQPYKQKLDQLFSKNPDLDNFKELAMSWWGPASNQSRPRNITEVQECTNCKCGNRTSFFEVVSTFDTSETTSDFRGTQISSYDQLELFRRLPYWTKYSAKTLFLRNF